MIRDIRLGHVARMCQVLTPLSLDVCCPLANSRLSFKCHLFQVAFPDSVAGIGTMPVCSPGTQGLLCCGLLIFCAPCHLAWAFSGVGTLSLYSRLFAWDPADHVCSVRLIEGTIEKCLTCHQIFMP